MNPLAERDEKKVTKFKYRILTHMKFVTHLLKVRFQNCRILIDEENVSKIHN